MQHCYLCLSISFCFLLYAFHILFVFFRATLFDPRNLMLRALDLLREVAVFAERSDVAEEVARLTGHLHQFEQVISPKHAEPAGRTLDFLSQEMLREANTIASKSQDVETTRAAVDIKVLIEQMREQVQNVE